MTLKQQIQFFFTTYHTGAINILMHIISLYVHFAIAWPTKSIPLVLLAFGIEEVGHWHDYFFRFKNKNKQKSIQIIPLKIIIVTIFCVFMTWAYNWI